MKKVYYEKFIAKGLVVNPNIDYNNSIYYVSSSASEYYSPKNYFYKKNKYGYRSSDFNNEIDILTVGCSHSFGVGLPVEFTWSEILNILIPDQKIANLSIPGKSVQSLISKIFDYFNEIGIPKVIVCLFPGYDRYQAYNKNSDKIETFYLNRIGSNQNKKDSLQKELVINLTFEYIKMLEIFCKSFNIKFIWSFWSQTDKLFHNFKDKEDYIFDNNKYVLKENYKSFHYTDVEPDFFEFKQNCSFNSQGVLHYDESFNQKHFNNIDYQMYKNKIKPKKDKNSIESYQLLGYSHDEYAEKLFNQFEDCLDFAYDRYTVPSFYQNIDLQKLWSEEKMDKIKKETLNKNYNFAHPGLKFNIFWAEQMAKAISSF
jgi:hypothetical protein